MSKVGKGILIVSLHKTSFSSNLNNKFAYYLFGSQIKLLAYTKNSTSSATSLSYMGVLYLFTFVFVHVVRFFLESDVVLTYMKLYQYLYIFYPNVKCSVTMVRPSHARLLAL